MGNYLIYAPPATNDLKDHLSATVLASILSDLSTDAEKLAAVNAKLDAAESEVDSYLAAQYAVPLTAPPEAVVEAAATLTVVRLYQRTSSIPEDAWEAAKATRVWLALVAAGKISLVLAEADVGAPAATTGVVMSDTQERQFSRATMGMA
jgi:phage gp36-like protein